MERRRQHVTCVRFCEHCGHLKQDHEISYDLPSTVAIAVCTSETCKCLTTDPHWGEYLVTDSVWGEDYSIGS